MAPHNKKKGGFQWKKHCRGGKKKGSPPIKGEKKKALPVSKEATPPEKKMFTTLAHKGLGWVGPRKM